MPDVPEGGSMQEWRMLDTNKLHAEQDFKRYVFVQKHHEQRDKCCQHYRML